MNMMNIMIKRPEYLHTKKNQNVQLDFLRIFSVKFILSLFIFFPIELVAQTFTINGYVKDKKGEELIGASVFIRQLNKGISTNEYGFYSLTIPQGTYTLECLFIGYEKGEQEVQLDENKRIDFYLEVRSTEIKEVTITGKAVDQNIKKVEMSTISLQMKTIEKIPTLFGEKDILKAIQLLPGVLTGVEGSGGFYVRGGNVDQNLTLLDGANIYNSSHLSGFMSVFNPDIIKNLKLYKGGIPAEYGGKLSSVLDIRMKEGSNKEFDGTLGIGTISSRLLLENPIVKDKGSIIVAARRTYADLFLKLSPDPALKDSKFYFYDLNIKGNYKINPKNRMFLSGYFGKDVIGFGQSFAIQYGNATGTLRWNSLLTDKLFMNVSYIYSNYNYNLRLTLDENNGFDWTSHIIDHKLNTNFTFFSNTNNTIKAGIESIYHIFKPGETNYKTSNTTIKYSLADNHTLETGVFIQNEQNINEIISLQYGIRFSIFQNIGATQFFEFDRSNSKKYSVTDTIEYKNGEFYNTYFGIEPRLSLRYMLDDKSSLKSSYNRIYQYVHLATNSIQTTPLDIWFPSSPNVKPQYVDQITLGYFRNIKNNTIETSVETFYKKMYNTIDFKNHADVLINKEFEGELRVGEGWAYGAEFFVRKQTGKLTGWISYTYSKAMRKILEIQKEPFYAPYDKPHDISIVASYQISNRVNISSNWVYSTAPPLTIPVHKAEVGNAILPIYTDRNTYRHKNYHRLDLSLTLDTRNKKGTWNFSIYNVYNRHNTYALKFEQDENKINVYNQYLFTILPSITYNFKF